ncbi:hypothetical protein [Paenibacillus sp. LHD-38]|uniref:hypothetical protein n=1 Tax=Paenibacillus sp. LHD-38 TaxID=3072143 RepID=UPI00280CC925|nr:hypothetical protein [Paenibacillus sp. LHD-38]MDQ8738687.1 hypothetical protein [Paenibacillus sp. LHD-38]
MMNKQQFIEKTVKEQRSIVIRVKNADEFVRGISREVNEKYLFVETEECSIFKVAITDIIEIFAIQSPSQNRNVSESHSDETQENGYEPDLIIAQYKNLNDDDQQQIISDLSKHFGKLLIISRSELATYNSAEVEMISNLIRSKCFQKLNNMDLPQKIFFGQLNHNGG